MLPACTFLFSGQLSLADKAALGDLLERPSFAPIRTEQDAPIHDPFAGRTRTKAFIWTIDHRFDPNALQDVTLFNAFPNLVWGYWWNTTLYDSDTRITIHTPGFLWRTLGVQRKMVWNNGERALNHPYALSTLRTAMDTPLTFGDSAHERLVDLHTLPLTPSSP